MGADPTAIAASLSEAQKQALASGKWNVGNICNELISLGLVAHEERRWVALTHLGLAVRAKLEGGR